MKNSSPIKHAAVLGAGVMGAQLSGLFANKGIKTYLFDISIVLYQKGKCFQLLLYKMNNNLQYNFYMIRQMKL